MADPSDADIFAQLQDEELDGDMQAEGGEQDALEQEEVGEVPAGQPDAPVHGGDESGLCKSSNAAAEDGTQEVHLKNSSVPPESKKSPAVMEPPLPSKKRGLVAVTKKPASVPLAADGPSAPSNTVKHAAAQAVAVKKKEPSTEKPAAAAAAKPAAKKAAPDAKAPSEPKNKAAKATKENNGPKVKRAKSAYMFFCSDQRSSIKAEHPDFTMGDLSKELAKRWKELPTDEKTPFEALASEDKERAGNERHETKAAGAPAKTGSKDAPAGRSKKPKQPRVKSAYQLFCDSKRAEVKEANPGAEFKTLSTLLGAAWKDASNDEKAPFIAQNQELKAQLEADNPKPAGSSKAVATAPASAVAATSAPSTDHDCQSGAGDGAESSGNADEGAPAGTAAKAPAPAAAAAATAAKVKAKAPAKKKTAAATVSAAAAAVEAGDDEEESIEQELMNVNWEEHPAEYIVAETYHAKYLVKRKGLDFSACGLVDARAAKRQRLPPSPPAAEQVAPDQAAKSACPVSVAMMDEYEAFNRSFLCAVHAHSDSGELDLDDLNQESPLEMCSLLGVLREPNFPLSRVADKNKDVMIKVPMMGVSRAVQRVVCLERAAWQDKFSELCTQLAAKDDVIVQLRAQLTGTKGQAVPFGGAAAEE